MLGTGCGSQDPQVTVSGHVEVSINGDTLQIMAYNSSGKSYLEHQTNTNFRAFEVPGIKIDDSEVPPFQETSISKPMQRQTLVADLQGFSIANDGHCH